MGDLRRDIMIRTFTDGQTGTMPPGCAEIESLNNSTTVTATITQHLANGDTAIITIPPKRTYNSPYIPNARYGILDYDGGEGGDFDIVFIYLF